MIEIVVARPTKVIVLSSAPKNRMEKVESPSKSAILSWFFAGVEGHVICFSIKGNHAVLNSSRRLCRILNGSLQ